MLIFLLKFNQLKNKGNVCEIFNLCFLVKYLNEIIFNSYKIQKMCGYVQGRESSSIMQRPRGKLIQALQKIQEKQGYLSEKAISNVARRMNISPNDIYGVASFYSQFRFTRPGKHIIKVCLGTACHVRGGENLLETVERKLNIHQGETTKDGKYSLERVACFGCCALAPVMVINNQVYGRVNNTKVKKILVENSPKRSR